MTYTFAAIVEQEDVDETWLPRITDKSGTVRWGNDDGAVKSFRASGLVVSRGGVGTSHRLLRVNKVSIDVHASSARLVAVCRKYDKGGGWIGSGGAMLLANTVSKVRAAVRSHGKFLVGQVRWPWLSHVGYTEKTGWTSYNKLRLVVLDSQGHSLYADFTLPRDLNARAVAEDIIETASRARNVSAPELPAYQAGSNEFVMAAIPGAEPAAGRAA